MRLWPCGVSANRDVVIFSSGSSKKVKLVIRSDVDHIATSIGQLSSSRGKFTSPEYLRDMLEARISAKGWGSQGWGSDRLVGCVGSW